MMGTSYPPGMDGTTVMRNTATALQAALRGLLASDLTARALDDAVTDAHDSPGPHEDWQASWAPSMVSTRTWESIYGPLGLTPRLIPEPERRTHRCDESCDCPADGLPMFYAPSTGQHACQDPDCWHAHPDGD